MKLVTWNINSVRLRIGLIEDLVRKENPDVICLQETKVMDGAFPIKAFKNMGYCHHVISGMKSYNGVAIFSRLPMSGKESIAWCGKQDCRHVSALLPRGVELHCAYVPAGGYEPDPVMNEKFAHKLAFVDEMTEFWTTQRSSAKPIILVGDLNIAPLENDVWSHKQMQDVVSHTPVEIEKFTKMQRSLDFVDAVRHFVPEEEKLYSWWSYRAGDWEKSDRGRRLDHIWVTPPLQEKLKATKTIRDARGWQPKPSDHVPVIIEMDL